jgi:hypothetical protein
MVGSRLGTMVGLSLAVLVLASCNTQAKSATSTTRRAPRHTSPTTSTPPPSPTSTVPPQIAGFLAQSVSFVTADDGFVLGDVACPSGPCPALRHTMDRGASWTSVSAPPSAVAPGPYSPGPELHFADGLDGWVYGATLWATHDGAQQWYQVNLGGAVVAMASGAGEAYALVDPCASTTCSGVEQLYRSPVGRDAWTVVLGVSGRPFGLVSLVAEGRTVFMLISPPGTAEIPEILESPDGVHFVQLPVPCGPAAPPYNGPVPPQPAALAASDPSNLAVACTGGIAAGNVYKEAYLSHDGGHSYQRLPDPPTGGDGAQLAMPAPSTLLLASDSAAALVYRIAPPASSWTTAIWWASGGLPATDLGFVDPAYGALIYCPATYAISTQAQSDQPPGLGTLYLTDNGGSSWYPVAIPA